MVALSSDPIAGQALGGQGILHRSTLFFSFSPFLSILQVSTQVGIYSSLLHFLAFSLLFLSTMAALQTSSSCQNSFANFVGRHDKRFSAIRQVGFASFYRQRRRKLDSVCIVSRSYGGGFSASQDESSPLEDNNKEKGLLLGEQRDGSGSVVGFHLIPPSGMRSEPTFFCYFNFVFCIFIFYGTLLLEFLPLLDCSVNMKWHFHSVFLFYIYFINHE